MGGGQRRVEGGRGCSMERKLKGVGSTFGDVGTKQMEFK